MHGTAIGVVARVPDELIIRAQGEVLGDLEAIIGLKDLLHAVVQPGVTYGQADSARRPAQNSP
jgi:hypothetical protein